MSTTWASRKVLVLGGAGFCGAHLCEQLLERGAHITALDAEIQPGGYFQRAGLRSKVDFRYGDILNLAELQALLAEGDFDVVFHLAAQPIVSISNARPLETAHANIIGTYNILEAIRLSEKKPPLIFASSGAYYGATCTTSAIQEEESALVAGNIYAPTKAAADLAVRCYARVYGLQAACCRWMNTYGPGDTNFTRIVPATIRRLSKGETALIDGTDGTNVLEALHVRDMIEAYLCVAENIEKEEVRGHAFNFGGGTPITLRDLTTEITRAWNTVTGQQISEEPRITGPHIESVKYLDISKAKEVLGWEPKIPLQEGLQETARWYVENLQSK